MKDQAKFKIMAKAVANTLGCPDEWEFILRKLLSAYELGRDDMARDIRSLISAQEVCHVHCD